MRTSDMLQRAMDVQERLADFCLRFASASRDLAPAERTMLTALAREKRRLTLDIRLARREFNRHAGPSGEAVHEIDAWHSTVLCSLTVLPPAEQPARRLLNVLLALEEIGARACADMAGECENQQLRPFLSALAGHDAGVASMLRTALHLAPPDRAAAGDAASQFAAA